MTRKEDPVFTITRECTKCPTTRCEGLITPLMPLERIIAEGDRFMAERQPDCLKTEGLGVVEDLSTGTSTPVILWMAQWGPGRIEDERPVMHHPSERDPSLN